MAREIKLCYRVESNYRSRIVECINRNDLYHYLAANWIMKNYLVDRVTMWSENYKPLDVPFEQDPHYHVILKQHQNLSYAVMRLIKAGYRVKKTESIPDSVLEIWRMETKDGTFTITICDDNRDGCVSINNQPEQIDEWIERRKT